MVNQASPRYHNTAQLQGRKLIAPLCAATGTNLLRQFIDLQAALEEQCEVTRLADLLRAA